MIEAAVLYPHYYDIGKKVVSLKTKKNFDLPELESSWKKMAKLDEDVKRKKELLAIVNKRKNKQSKNI